MIASNCAGIFDSTLKYSPPYIPPPPDVSVGFPLYFELPAYNYEIAGFGGATGTISSTYGWGDSSSCMVTKNSTSDASAGVRLKLTKPMVFNLPWVLMYVRVPKAMNVTAKLLAGTNGNGAAKTATKYLSNPSTGWTFCPFNFGATNSSTYGILEIAFDTSTANTGESYYWDYALQSNKGTEPPPPS